MELSHDYSAVYALAGPTAAPLDLPVVVGCALLPKKVQRYLTPRMLQTAAEHKIMLKPIDYNQPLEPQGPFNVIIHKLRPNPSWEQQLRQYVLDHPEVVVVDSIDKIRQLHNRSTMLRPLQGAGIILQQPQHTCMPAHAASQPAGQAVLVQAPLQVEILEGMTEAEAQAALAAAGLSPPLLCKPLWTDGRDGSHKLAVLHDLEALGRLLRGQVCHEFKPPLVVQQFVEHGGVLFKVYVLGEQTYCTARPSLGETVLEPAHAVQQLPRISCVSVFSKQQQHQHRMQQPQLPQDAPSPAAATGRYEAKQQEGGAHPSSTDLAPLGDNASQQQQHSMSQEQPQQRQQPSAALAAVSAASVWRPPCSIVVPPAWLTSALAATLRQELGMQLFNFDLIVPEQQPIYDSPQGQQHHGIDDSSSSADAAPALCYVVDINFFPGVDKIPDFERKFVTFLLAAAASGASGASSSRTSAAKAAKQQAVAQQALMGPAAAAKQASEGSSLQAAGSGSGNCRHTASSGGNGSNGDNGIGRRSSSSSGGGCGGSSRRLQHSLSADRAAGAGGVAGGVGSRRLSGTGGSSGGSRHGSSGQWGDRGVIGSSPPPQLQVAGCS